VLDEKWKDHLYDLDQLRNAIHYRSWGQKDPLVEYKQEAYTMFVDLMNDIYNTFSDRFLKVQLQFGPPPGQEGGQSGGPPRGPFGGPSGGPSGPDGGHPPQGPTRRFNAMGIMEDVSTPEPAGEDLAMDIGPEEPPKPGARVRQDPVVIGAGRSRSLNAQPTGDVDWTTVGRNDPCPCGSGKKFKKCHGATA
jgi:preprotein translocase subunit SecA